MNRESQKWCTHAFYVIGHGVGGFHISLIGVGAVGAVGNARQAATRAETAACHSMCHIVMC